jgi:hypothetical protein
MTGRRDTPDHSSESPELRGFDDFDLCLGDIMRGERATLGKSLLDVQRELKIKATYISAIENTDPSAFDTPGFVAGYVRSYARYLGLDPEWAFKTFCEEGDFTVAHGMSQSSSVRTPSKMASSTSGSKTPAHMRDMFTEPSVSYLPKGEAAFSGIEPRAVGSIVVLCALLMGIGYGGWAVLQEVQKVRLTPVDQTPEVLVELDPLTSATEQSEEVAELNNPQTPDVFDRLYRPEALDVPVLTARDGPISAIDPNSVGTLVPRQSENFIASGSPIPDDPFVRVPTVAEASGLNPEALLPPPVQVVAEPAPTVTLLAVRPSWVRVQGADGTVIFEKILDAGEQFEVPLTEEAPVLRAGNAGSLYFDVAGETYGPAGGGPEVIKDVALSPDAVRERYEIADADADNDLARFVAVAQAGTETE